MLGLKSVLKVLLRIRDCTMLEEEEEKFIKHSYFGFSHKLHIMFILNCHFHIKVVSEVVNI